MEIKIFVLAGPQDIAELRELLLDGWIILRADPIKERIIYILHKD